MNPAMYTVLAAMVGAFGIIIGAVVSAILNRHKDASDIATKVSAAWDPVFERVNDELTRVSKQCDKCETRLTATQKALRAVIHALDTDDQAARVAAITAARELV